MFEENDEEKLFLDIQCYIYAKLLLYFLYDVNMHVLKFANMFATKNYVIETVS